MKRGMGWPIGIGTILILFVAANLFVMRLATTDPSFAIEPDYYNKAVAFDSTMAEERRSAALGWSASSIIAAGDTRTGPAVTVTLADAKRQPIVDASVTITALFNARANDVLSATLHEHSPGQYGAPLAVRYAGQWEVRVDAVRGTDHFVTSTRTIAPAVR
jgi:Predicted integral membrane protein linked to a cation pump